MGWSSWLREAAESGQRWDTVATGLRNVELDVDVLDSELSSLDDGSQRRLAQTQSCPHQEETHRQNPQQ
jgi:hypothetical protein